MAQTVTEFYPILKDLLTSFHKQRIFPTDPVLDGFEMLLYRCQLFLPRGSSSDQLLLLL